MQKTPPFAPRFPLGDTLVTCGVNTLLEAGKIDPQALLRRHQSGDWGCVPPDDARTNEDALLTGSRLISSYLLDEGTKVWIITEADRSSTTILLPDEY